MLQDTNSLLTYEKIQKDQVINHYLKNQLILEYLILYLKIKYKGYTKGKEIEGKKLKSYYC